MVLVIGLFVFFVGVDDGIGFKRTFTFDCSFVFWDCFSIDGVDFSSDLERVSSIVGGDEDEGLKYSK